MKHVAGLICLAFLPAVLGLASQPSAAMVDVDRQSSAEVLAMDPDSSSAAMVSLHSLPDDRKTKMFSYSNLLAMDTSLPSYTDITLRQLTDGVTVVKAVLGPYTKILDCDVSFDENDVTRFTKTFTASQLKEIPQSVRHMSWERVDNDLKEFSDVDGLVAKCRYYQKEMYTRMNQMQQRAAKFPPERHHGRSRRSIVWPGTKWCGKGDEASRYTSLGASANTDRCCRLHDHCPYIIEGMTSKYGTFNYRFHTISHCDCDHSFRTCLRNTNSGPASLIGSIYFNVVSLPCFIFVPRRTCIQRRWWGKCERHSLKYVAEVQEGLDFS